MKELKESPGDLDAGSVNSGRVHEDTRLTTLNDPNTGDDAVSVTGSLANCDFDGGI